MKKFEYDVFNSNIEFGRAYFDLEGLTELGRKGWEVVCTLAGSKQLLLKREVEQPLNTENKDNAITEDELDEPEQTQEQIQEEYRHSFSS